MRFAGEEELAARGLGDGCGDLMFFFLRCLISLSITDRSLSHTVSSLRLARASRGASRPFFLPSHCLLVSFSSRLVRASRRASRSSSRSIPVLPFLRLVVSSCRGVLLARLVFFSFVLSPSPCGFRYGVPAWASCYRIIPMGVRLAPPHCGLRLAPYLLATKPLCGVRARPAVSGYEAMRASRHGRRTTR